MEPIKDLLRTLSSSSQIPVATFCSEACLVICSYHMGLLSFFKSVVIFGCVYVCVCRRVCHVFGCLEASYRWLHHQIWAQGVELGFSERAIHTFNHWALSPAMTCLLSKSWRSLISPPVLELCPFRYPNTACELLTCDVPQISDRLGEDESLLNLLYDFLDQEPPLNPLLASFFSKTIGNLIARKTEQVMICEAKCIGQSLLPLWNCHQALETAFCLLNRTQMNSVSGWYVNCCLSEVPFQRGFCSQLWNKQYFLSFLGALQAPHQA